MIFLDDEPNEKNWNGIQRIVKNTEKYPIEFSHYIQEDRITEIPPGTHRYKFTIKTTNEFHITSIMTNGIGICHEIEIVAIDHNGNEYISLPQVVPLLYEKKEDLPFGSIGEMESSSRKGYKQYSLCLMTNTNKCRQGDVVEGKVTVTNTSGKEIDKAILSFETIAYDSTYQTLSSQINCSKIINKIPEGNSEHSFSFKVPMTTPADIAIKHLQIFNAVTFQFTTGLFKKTTSRIVSPIIIVPKVPNEKNIEEYMNSMNRSIVYNEQEFDSLPYGYEPEYDKIISDGIEVAYTSDFKRIEMKHTSDRKRNFYNINSLCLPSHLSVGKVLNQLVFANHKTKTCSYKDPRPVRERLPQHIMKEKVNVYFALSIEETKGIPPNSKFVVRDYSQKYKIQNKNVVIPIDVTRNNVVITVKYEKKCLGYIDIDLNLLPFEKITSSWYFLTESEGSEFGFCGMVKVKVSYLSNSLNEFNQSNDYPAYLSRFNFPCYFPTKGLLRTIQLYHEIDNASSTSIVDKQAFIKIENNQIVIDFNHYLDLNQRVKTFFPMTIPQFKSQIMYIQTSNVISVKSTKGSSRTQSPFTLYTPRSQQQSDSSNQSPRNTRPASVFSAKPSQSTLTPRSATYTPHSLTSQFSSNAPSNTPNHTYSHDDFINVSSYNPKPQRPSSSHSLIKPTFSTSQQIYSPTGGTVSFSSPQNSNQSSSKLKQSMESSRRKRFLSVSQNDSFE